MFMDEVVLAGLLIVGGTILVGGGIAFFAWRDACKKKKTGISS